MKRTATTMASVLAPVLSRAQPVLASLDDEVGNDESQRSAQQVPS